MTSYRGNPDAVRAMFDGASEMVEKVGYFLDHPGRREAITEAGHLRCLNGGISLAQGARLK